MEKLCLSKILLKMVGGGNAFPTPPRVPASGYTVTYNSKTQSKSTLANGELGS